MPQAEIEQQVRKVAEMLQLDATARPHARSSCPAASASASRSAARSSAIPRSSCSTSRSPTSMPRCAYQMRLEIARLHADLGATMIYVTHDQVEAMTLADRIVVLNARRDRAGRHADGALQPPANIFVAGFIGSPKMNFLHGTIVGGEKHLAVDINGCRFPLPADVSVTPGHKVIVGLRPEDVSLAKEGAYAVCLATPVVREHLGSETLVYYRSPASGELLIVKSAGLQDPAKEQTTLFAARRQSTCFAKMVSGSADCGCSG